MIADKGSRPEVLGLVLARGGSRGIPRKNLAPLAGKPLIAYTIETALASETITRLIVSTEDDEIARVSRQLGAETPFKRPAELATDTAQDLPAFRHALSWLEENEDYKPDVLVHLRPTSPFRLAEDIDGTVRLLLAHPEATAVRTVSRPSQNPFKMWRIENGYMKPLIPIRGREGYNMPRQELPTVFWQNGLVDVAWRSTILAGSMTGDRILPYIIEHNRVVDIDTPLSLRVAEFLYLRNFE